MCPIVLLEFLSSAPGIEQPVSETEGCMGIASDICKQVILTIFECTCKTLIILDALKGD